VEIHSRGFIPLCRTRADIERGGLCLRLADQLCNQSIARLLQSFGRIYFDQEQATDLYTRQCSLNVSAKDLAVMRATLADGGLNPLSRERVVDE
jgi:glutaminase